MEELITGNRELSPDAVSVTPLKNHVLRVRFVNGELRDFDVKPLLSRKCFRALESDTLFRTAHISFGVVEWANGMDIDPEWLYGDSVPVAKDSYNNQQEND